MLIALSRQIITGKMPWDSMSRAIIEEKGLKKPGSMPDTVWSFVQACMEKSPGKRPSSEEALKTLQSLLDTNTDW